MYNGERPHDSLGRVPPLTFLPRLSSAAQYLTGKLTPSPMQSTRAGLRDALQELYDEVGWRRN